jgi:RNA polymerase sigma-70 factor (ECF subfamily)
LIQELPTGYKTVFNLYAVEGYKHKEIAKILEISENTSKSQLIRARLMLQKKLEELEKGK